MRQHIVMGTETEYAVTALDHEGRVLPIDVVIRQMRERVQRRPHLPGNESGLFLRNGARWYIDAGTHPEYATPEATTPHEAVRYALAGDQLMAQLAREVTLDDPRIASLLVRNGNVDYASHATWGSHENYLHRGPSTRIACRLIPHLVSRLVFTGAGGLERVESRGLRFVLSPRTRFVRRLVDQSAPGEIALVDTREQPHCDLFSRQHLMCGDANRSHLSMLLRVGTTALVVMLADLDVDIAAVRLANPMSALKTVAADTTLSHRVELAGGGTATALDIQRHYLQVARAHVSRLPGWASALCEVWQDTLDRLQQGPDAVADRLDWAIKLALFRTRARPDANAGDRGCVLQQPAASATLPEVWQAHLCEIDLRYGQVHPPGLFDALDESGVLRHRVAGIDRIEDALESPPCEGRARLRGLVVARLAGRRDGSICGWAGIVDGAGSIRLDLSDPFATDESWSPVPPAEPTAHDLIGRLERLIAAPVTGDVSGEMETIVTRLAAPRESRPPMRSAAHAVRLNNLAFELRATGRPRDAEALMRAALAIDLGHRLHSDRKIAHRRNNLATVLLMQGRVAEARNEATLAWPVASTDHDLTTARVLTIRLAIAMVYQEPYALFVGQLKTHLALQPLRDFADVDAHWQMDPVLKLLRPRLGMEEHDVLQAAVHVLNGSGPLDALDQFPSWRGVAAAPLHLRWPTDQHGGNGG